jgi:hypothetical protein
MTFGYIRRSNRHPCAGMESVMTNITASELERARSTVKNRRRLAFRNWVHPDKLEVPSNINSPVINPPTVVVLDTPTSMFANPSTMLISTHIQARNSTAQIDYNVKRVNTSVEAFIGFSFWFHNFRANPVLLSDITSHIVLNGRWDVYGACSYVPPTSTSIISFVDLQIVEFWKQPPSFPPQEDGQYAEVITLTADGGWCVTNFGGEQKLEWILNKSYNVGYSSLEVPPKGVVLFEMRLGTLTAPFISHDGAANVSSSIVCPFVQFEVRDAIQHGPPI